MTWPLSPACLAHGDGTERDHRSQNLRVGATGRCRLCRIVRGEVRGDHPRWWTTVVDANGGSHRVRERRDCDARGRCRHEPVDDIVRNAMTAGADIIQLHGDPSPRMVLDLRERWPGGIWATLRVQPAAFDAARAAALFAVADGLVLDAFVPGALGGTGTAIDWRALAAPLDALRAESDASALLVLAGGLTPENVRTAIVLLSPDVVDVSSGVESSPGIKNHARVQRFVASARGDRDADEQLSLTGVQ